MYEVSLYFLIKVLSLCAGALPLPHMWRLVSGVVGEGPLRTPDYLRGRGVTSGGVGPWVGAALRGRPAHMCRCGVFTARARASAADKEFPLRYEFILAFTL